MGNNEQLFTLHQEKRVKEYNRRRMQSVKLMRESFEKYGLKPTQ